MTKEHIVLGGWMPDKKQKYPAVRFSYLYVFKTNMDNKFSVELIIPKDHPQVDEIKAALKKVVADAQLKDIKLSSVLHDGDFERAEKKEYEKCWYIKAKTAFNPTIKGIIGGVTRDLKENEIKAGDFGVASIDFVPYERNGGGITTVLNGLCKTADGERLGGGNSCDKEFESLAGGAKNESDDDLL